jgi:hypothetical protein
MSNICTIEGCSKTAFRRTLCAMHYSRLLRRGATDDSCLLQAPNGAPLKWLQEHVDYDSDECLTFPFDRGRMGRVTLNGRRMVASRAMCILAHGDPPTPTHHAAHFCGKGHESCVNPSHLRWATSKENNRDKIAHGTMNWGERHGQSKFTKDDVRAIRSALRAGELQRVIAERHATTQAVISKIARRVTWGWFNG